MHQAGLNFVYYVGPVGRPAARRRLAATQSSKAVPTAPPPERPATAP